jgi:hypothetical protein
VGEAVARGGVRGDDRVRPATRVLAIVIVPFLLAGFGILFLFPDRNGEVFAWAVRPRMTAMMLGATYLGGAWFFLRVWREERWHRVKAGFLPVALFAGMLGTATLLHLDRFEHGHAAFWAWTALYFTTPFLVLGAWLRNRSADPGPLGPGEVLTPPLLRAGLCLAGATVLAVAALLFAEPGPARQVWPWALTPLTARVVASLFAVGGSALLSVGLDRRWDAARATLQSQALALAGIELATAISWSDFDHGSPLAWLFGGGLLLLLASLAAADLALARREQRGGR